MLRRILSEENVSTPGPISRWGFLGLFLLLNGWIVYTHVSGEGFDWQKLVEALFISMTLVFNHLAFSFAWKGRTRLYILLAEVGWLLFCLLVIWRNHGLW